MAQTSAYNVARAALREVRGRPLPLVGLSHRPAALALLALEELVNCFDELSPDDYETVEGFLDELRGLEYQGE